MGRILTLAQDLRNAGVDRVVEVAGWQSRGSSTFHPKVLIEHHTASNRRGGNAPSLGVCINGRPGLPGPLCQVLFGRDGTAYVIASGRANHAGVGSWRGVSGNTNAIGFEIENDGIGEPYSAHLREQVRRASVAVLRRIGRDASWCCAHFEWAPTRKIDPGTPKWNMNAWRASLTHTAPTPDLPSTGDVMYAYVVDKPGLHVSFYGRTWTYVAKHAVPLLKKKGVKFREVNAEEARLLGDAGMWLAGNLYAGYTPQHMLNGHSYHEWHDIRR